MWTRQIESFRICRIPATHAGKFFMSNSGHGASLITIMLINFTPFHQFQDLNFAGHMLAFTVHGFGTTSSTFFWKKNLHPDLTFKA